jgi:hypothetical protein
MGGGTSKLQQVAAAVEEAEEALQTGRLESAIKICEQTRYCAEFRDVILQPLHKSCLSGCGIPIHLHTT